MNKTALLPFYAPASQIFVQGQGVWLWDRGNRRYLDATSGIAVCGLGHAHPAVNDALHEQCEKLIHTSNLFRIEKQEMLADALVEITGMTGCFFINSGAEANETAIKLARLYAYALSPDTLPVIIVAKNAFHGRTLAALSASDLAHSSDPFRPLVPGFVQTVFGDVASLKASIEENPQAAAVMLEPIQGEGGVRVPPAGYLRQVREICDEHGLLMILDEVQTGVGRTGEWYAYHHESVLPDILCTAKGLGNGMPIGCCLCNDKVAQYVRPGLHGSTFGGNPLACSAALAVLSVIREEKLLPTVRKTGDYLLNCLRQQLDFDCVSDIRGRGLMVGVELDRDCTQIAETAMDAGLLVNIARQRTIRLLPPLIIDRKEIDMVVDILFRIIKAL